MMLRLPFFVLLLAVAALGQPMSGVYPVGPGGPGVDSFATVQEAASALTARGLAGNVEFPISQFVYTGPVALRNVANSRDYTTRFLPKAAGATIDAGGARYAFSVEGTHNVTLQGMRFQGVRDTGSACIRYADCDSGLVWGCRMVSDSADIGLLLERTAHFMLDSSRVQGTMRGASSRALDLRACSFTDVHMCSILGTTGTGVNVAGGMENMLMKVGVKAASEYGLRIENSPRAALNQCVVIGQTANGLRMVNVPNAMMESVLVNGTQQQSVYFESCDSLESVALMLFGSSERGVALIKSHGCNFMRLTIQTGPKRGLVLDRSADCLIDSLQVVNVDSDTAVGVLLDSAPGSIFRWGMLYGNYGTGFAVRRSDGSRFAHVRVFGAAADAAIAIEQSSGVTVRPCSLVCVAPAAVTVGDNCNDDTLARVTILGTTRDGIVARNCRGLVLANNCVRGWTENGLVLNGASSPRLYYNTVVGPDSVGVAVVALTDVTGAEVKDNIIWNRGPDTSACYRITGTFPLGPGASDYNDLYASRGALVRVGDTVYNDLPAWRAHAAGPDQRSISRDPLFVAGDNYHLSLPSPCRDSGIPIPGFLYDIEYDERDSLSPDIGADEFTPGAVAEAGPLPPQPRFELRGNPTGRDFVTIEFGPAIAGPVDVAVVDISGRTAARSHFANPRQQMKLDISDLRAGVYLVRVAAGRQTSTQKLVVQR